MPPLPLSKIDAQDSLPQMFGAGAFYHGTPSGLGSQMSSECAVADNFPGASFFSQSVCRTDAGGAATGIFQTSSHDSLQISDGRATETTTGQQWQQPEHRRLCSHGEEKSIGSLLHPNGCSPCVFFCFKVKGCDRGVNCAQCHRTHTSQRQLQARAWKEVQRQRRQAVRVSTRNLGCERSPGSPAMASHDALAIPLPLSLLKHGSPEEAATPAYGDPARAPSRMTPGHRGSAPAPSRAPPYQALAAPMYSRLALAHGRVMPGPSKAHAHGRASPASWGTPPCRKGSHLAYEDETSAPARASLSQMAVAPEYGESIPEGRAACAQRGETLAFDRLRATQPTSVDFRRADAPQAQCNALMHQVEYNEFETWRWASPQENRSVEAEFGHQICHGDGDVYEL